MGSARHSSESWNLFAFEASDTKKRDPSLRWDDEKGEQDMDPALEIKP
jgi:hypothetical protein